HARSHPALPRGRVDPPPGGPPPGNKRRARAASIGGDRARHPPDAKNGAGAKHAAHQRTTVNRGGGHARRPGIRAGPEALGRHGTGPSQASPSRSNNPIRRGHREKAPRPKIEVSRKPSSCSAARTRNPVPARRGRERKTMPSNLFKVTVIQHWLYDC